MQRQWHCNHSIQHQPRVVLSLQKSIPNEWENKNCQKINNCLVDVVAIGCVQDLCLCGVLIEDSVEGDRFVFPCDLTRLMKSKKEAVTLCEQVVAMAYHMQSVMSMSLSVQPVVCNVVFQCTVDVMPMYPVSTARRRCTASSRETPPARSSRSPLRPRRRRRRPSGSR